MSSLDSGPPAPNPVSRACSTLRPFQRTAAASSALPGSIVLIARAILPAVMGGQPAERDCGG